MPSAAAGSTPTTSTVSAASTPRASASNSATSTATTNNSNSSGSLDRSQPHPHDQLHQKAIDFAFQGPGTETFEQFVSTLPRVAERVLPATAVSTPPPTALEWSVAAAFAQNLSSQSSDILKSARSDDPAPPAISSEGDDIEEETIHPVGDIVSRARESRVRQLKMDNYTSDPNLAAEGGDMDGDDAYVPTIISRQQTHQVDREDNGNKYNDEEKDEAEEDKYDEDQEESNQGATSRGSAGRSSQLFTSEQFNSLTQPHLNPDIAPFSLIPPSDFPTDTQLRSSDIPESNENRDAEVAATNSETIEENKTAVPTLNLSTSAGPQSVSNPHSGQPTATQASSSSALSSSSSSASASATSASTGDTIDTGSSEDALNAAAIKRDFEMESLATEEHQVWSENVEPFSLDPNHDYDRPVPENPKWTTDELKIMNAPW